MTKEVHVRKSERKNQVIGFVLPIEEAKALTEMARENDIAVSWWVRQVVRQALVEEMEHTAAA
jgi:hypothetical protein